MVPHTVHLDNGEGVFLTKDDVHERIKEPPTTLMTLLNLCLSDGCVQHLQMYRGSTFGKNVQNLGKAKCKALQLRTTQKSEKGKDKQLTKCTQSTLDSRNASTPATTYSEGAEIFQGIRNYRKWSSV